MNKKFNKLGQVSIFVIIGIVILVGVIAYLILRTQTSGVQVPPSLEPVYSTFLSCLEDNVLVGVDVLESQGGYIEMPDFEAGSSYMPFSSQLNFLGNPIPYWYYVSGNNFQKEQVPTKSLMEQELGNFIEEKIQNCVFDSYYDSGFEIVQKTPQADVVIENNKILVDLKMDFGISKGSDSVVVSNHNIEVPSELGTLYNSAIKIYQQEQSTLFLENYAVDVMRLYAPVDGVELTCSPKVWNAENVFSDLKEALEVNTLALRNKGGDFELKDPKNKYFVLDLGVNQNVRFLYSQNWPSAFEVSPTGDGPVMVSDPVGNQPGLGVIGFCYVPYHFVYNMKYPTMIQVYSEKTDEFFQFPMAVVIQGNLPREPINTNTPVDTGREFCKDKNTLTQINVMDKSFDPVDGRISYSCFGEVCEIGNSNQGTLEGNFPQCVNGVVIVEAEGFAKSRTIASVVNPSSVDVVLDKLYEKELSLKVDGKAYAGTAIINFVSDKVSQTVIYPDQKTVKLAEGQYTVIVNVYRESSLKIKGTTTTQCFQVPRSGLGGLVGLTEEKCVDLEIPDQIVSNVLSGGGTQEHYLVESELEGGSILEINADSLPVPKSLEELQTNYVLFEDKGLDIILK